MSRKVDVPVSKVFNLKERSFGGPAWIRAKADLKFTIFGIDAHEFGYYYCRAGTAECVSDSGNVAVFNIPHHFQYIPQDGWFGLHPDFSLFLGNETYTRTHYGSYQPTRHEYHNSYAWGKQPDTPLDHKWDGKAGAQHGLPVPPFLLKYDHYRVVDWYGPTIETGISNVSVVMTDTEISDLVYPVVSAKYTNAFYQVFTDRTSVSSGVLRYTSPPGFLLTPGLEAFQVDQDGMIVFREASSMFGAHEGDILGTYDSSDAFTILSIA